MRYSIIIGYPLASRLTQDRDRWRLSFRPRYPLTPAALRFCMETSLIGPSRSLHEISGIDVGLVAYEFPFDPPADTGLYSPLAPAQISFRATSDTGSVFGRRADLTSKLVATHPEARAFCEAYCQQELLRLTKPVSLVDRVNAILAESIDRIPGIAACAGRTGMSQRTLHRRLSEEGWTYRELVQTFRRERALLLLQHEVPLKSVAYMLGFDDDGSFRRAFKRWHGVSPARWRRDAVRPRAIDVGQLPTPLQPKDCGNLA